MPLPKFLLVPSLDSQLAEFRPHLSACLWGVWGNIHGELGCLSHMSKRASEAAVPLWNTEQRALTMAFQLSLQCTTPHLFPSSSPSFYCILLFFFSLSLSQRHKFTRSISRPELSHRRLADGDLHKHVGPLLRPAKWFQGLLTEEDYRGLSLSLQPALPRPSSSLPPLASPQKPSPPQAVFPSHGLWIAAAEWWHQEEGWGAKALRLLPSRLASRCL